MTLDGELPKSFDSDFLEDFSCYEFYLVSNDRVRLEINRWISMSKILLKRSRPECKSPHLHQKILRKNSKFFAVFFYKNKKFFIC